MYYNLTLNFEMEGIVSEANDPAKAPLGGLRQGGVLF
jgi:hypothetical protein